MQESYEAVVSEEVIYVRLYMGFDNAADKADLSHVQNDVLSVPGCRTFAF